MVRHVLAASSCSFFDCETLFCAQCRRTGAVESFRKAEMRRESKCWFRRIKREIKEEAERAEYLTGIS